MIIDERRVSFSRQDPSNFQSTLGEKDGLSAEIRRLISRSEKRKRNYIDASSDVGKCRGENRPRRKMRKKKKKKLSAEKRSVGRKGMGMSPLPSFRRRLPVSDIGIGQRRRRGRGLLGDGCGKFKTYIKRTNRQTSFQEEATRRAAIVGHIADHSLPNANYLYSAAGN